MISITAAQAGTIIVNIIPIGRVGAMLLATAEAVMAQLELSPVVQEVLCSGTLWGAEQPERLLVASLVRWSEGLSIRRTHVTITRCATVADDKAAI
jgi:hypothetical protein